MQEPVTTDRKHHKIAVSPELADRCLACGTCIGDLPGHGIGTGLGGPQGHPGSGFRAGGGGRRLQMALGLHYVRAVRI